MNCELCGNTFDARTAGEITVLREFLFLCPKCAAKLDTTMYRLGVEGGVISVDQTQMLPEKMTLPNLKAKEKITEE